MHFAWALENTRRNIANAVRYALITNRCANSSSHTLRRILHHKRHVEASLRDSSNATHFNTAILTRIARTILVKIPVLKCVNYLESQWLASTCRLCCRIVHRLSSNAPHSLVVIDHKSPYTYIAQRGAFICTHLCPPLRSTFAVRETASLGIMGGTSGAPLKPLRDDSVQCATQSSG